MHLHTRWTKHVLAFIAACFVCLLHSTFTKAQHQVWLNNNKLWALDFLQIGNIEGHWVNWESVANLLECITILQLQQGVGDSQWLRLSISKCKRTMRMTSNALRKNFDLGMWKWLREISSWSFSWTNHFCSWPTTSQRLEKEQRHKLLHWLLQITSLWCLSGRTDGAQPYFYSHDQSTPVFSQELCKGRNKTNIGM